MNRLLLATLLLSGLYVSSASASICGTSAVAGILTINNSIRGQSTISNDCPSNTSLGLPNIPDPSGDSWFSFIRNIDGASWQINTAATDENDDGALNLEGFFWRLMDISWTGTEPTRITGVGGTLVSSGIASVDSFDDNSLLLRFNPFAATCPADFPTRCRVEVATGTLTIETSSSASATIPAPSTLALLALGLFAMRRKILGA
ncbi:PEP-CTERM sorting domain-containing protein [Aestuariirhabdus sp. Z084]|uniref:PEP-CTERM sorting domain-containing protein n=1 Tax=Aestuariirhabdus haliotis TaxID=2918751 RepID=UPI00201B3B4D|nr:PEP-CTERM sorting domain-containing protein [Aestuariirhabdus haliotis]MCL6416810.1 PEP-CTERM sorting domain-containing protein [Aestuariirhabdus haliotis]MCL6420810.1 PEP-CTERM sorting domain-containing protein [Aestuariirhabdus haliotis]